MQLTLVNKTLSTKTYLSGAISVSADLSTSVSNTVQQLSLSTDGQLRADIFSGFINISDGITEMGGNDALDYLKRINTVIVALADVSGNGITSTASGSKQLLDVNAVTTQSGLTLNTYTASITGLSIPASATDILTITGSATKKVIINQINISATQTTAGVESISLIKRSTLNTAGGVASIVQSQNSYTTASSTTATVTVTSTGAGNLLVVGTSNLDNRTVSSVSDGTNAFTQATGSPSNGGGNTHTDVWYLTSSTAGKTTITVTFNGTSTTKGIWFWEVAGTNIAFDNATHNGASTVGAIDTGTAITTANTGFVIGVIGSNGSVTNSPATTNAQFTNGAINGSGKSAACWVLAPVGTYTPSWNDSGILVNFAASSAAFTVLGNVLPQISAVPHDSTQSAATAVVSYYLNNPILGTAVGAVRNVRAFVPTTAGSPEYTSWLLPNNFGKGIVLNNANESLSINLNELTLAGSNFAIDVEWTEQ
jgi:hypothetical protein